MSTASTSINPHAPLAKELRAREYETIYIMRPSVNPDEADRIADRIKGIIEARKGKLLRVDNWGRRRLAYPIAKATRGVFVYLRYVGFGDLVAEIERNLRLIDDVVRHLTVQVNDHVMIETFTVDPEDVKFRRLEEAPVEDDNEQELAARLGLVDRPRGEGGGGDDMGGYDNMDPMDAGEVVGDEDAEDER
jgi:small subunit ribosomal protein S6